MLMIAFASCKQIQYVPIETVKTEYKDIFVKDSVYLKDSIFVSQKGDTVFYTKFQTKYKYKYLRDSVYINDTVTVKVPIPTVVKINELNWFQKSLMYSGALAILFLLLYILFKFRKTAKKFFIRTTI